VEQTCSIAHRLVGHERCKYLHGHNFRVRLTVFSEDEFLDFAYLKGKLREVLNQLDHRTILGKRDRLKLPKVAKVFRLNGQPTCENLARWIHKRLKTFLRKYIIIRVWESDSCFVEFAG